MLPALFETRRLGIWLFMSEMPFGTLSVQMLWKLFYLMHQAESGTLETLCTALPPAECKKQLQGIAPGTGTLFPHLCACPLHCFLLFTLRRSKGMFYFAYLGDNFEIRVFVDFDLLECSFRFHYSRMLWIVISVVNPIWGWEMKMGLVNAPWSYYYFLKLLLLFY